MNKRKQLYALAVYLLLAAVAAILVLVAANYLKEDPWQGLLINLSTEVAGVVIIFFVVNRLFLLDKDSDLLEELTFLRKDVKSRFSPFVSRDLDRERFDLPRLLAGAESVDLVGYSFANLLGEHREHLVEAVQLGAKIRVLLVNPSSAASDLISRSTQEPERFLDAVRRSLRYLRDIRQLLADSNNAQDALTVRLISWIPSCHMIILDAKQGRGIARIGINSFSFRLGQPKRVSLILSREDYPTEFDYFAAQFELLWEDESTVAWDYSLPAQSKALETT